MFTVTALQVPIEKNAICVQFAKSLYKNHMLVLAFAHQLQANCPDKEHVVLSNCMEIAILQWGNL